MARTGSDPTSLRQPADVWQVYDRTNHLKRGTRPTGGNVLFVDGHVQWRPFSEMEHRWFWQRYDNPCFWW
ncbi:MAG: H-X9-DG-CTERM domain-containing protein [Planctomycetota bacterium]